MERNISTTLSYQLRRIVIKDLVTFTFVLGFLIYPNVCWGQGVVQEYTGNAHPDLGLIDCAVGSLFQLIEGGFGALVMVVAGLGAIVSAAMGAYRASVGMLVVAVGSYILRSLVTIFFGSGFQACEV